MSEQQPNDERRRGAEQRMPSWAGYILIAADVVRLPLFLVPWVGTLVALAMTLPGHSIWLTVVVLFVATLLTLATVVRAVASQATRRGALGAYVARLATQTSFGRWLTDLLSRPRD